MRRANHEMLRLLRIAAGMALLTGAAACGTPGTIAALPTPANPCPAWVEFPADRHSNQEAAYLGCSNEVNLKATLEAQGDFQRGRELGPASGVRESLTISQYETGQAKPLQSDGPPTPTIVFSGSNGGTK